MTLLLWIPLIVRLFFCLQLLQTQFQISRQNLAQRFRIGWEHAADEAMFIALKYNASMV